MKQYLLTSKINDKILYIKKISSDTVTYEYYSNKKEVMLSKKHNFPYAKQVAVAMMFLLFFLTN